MPDSMVRTQVYLPRDIYEALRERAEAQQSTMAMQIREALEAYLEHTAQAQASPVLRADDPLFALAGIAPAPDDLAQRHDHYLYAPSTASQPAPLKEKSARYNPPRKAKRKSQPK